MIPTAVKLHRKEGSLSLSYPDDASFTLSGEYLRVYSPSAEVKGHGAGQETLQYGKKDVCITAVDPVGNYALKLTFSDGHDSGIYSWEYLHGLCHNQKKNWEDYLARLNQAGKHREENIQVVKLIDPKNLNT